MKMMKMKTTVRSAPDGSDNHHNYNHYQVDYFSTCILLRSSSLSLSAVLIMIMIMMVSLIWSWSLIILIIMIYHIEHHDHQHLLACLKANSSAGGCDKSVSSEFSADLINNSINNLIKIWSTYHQKRWPGNENTIWSNLLGERLGLRFLNGLFCFRNVREFIRGFASYENEFCLKYSFKCCWFW